jgi:hypothetical protein
VRAAVTASEPTRNTPKTAETRSVEDVMDTSNDQ